MNRLFAILLSLILVLGTVLTPAVAEDAISSATVNITTLPELNENQNTTVLGFEAVARGGFKVAHAVAAEVEIGDAEKRGYILGKQEHCGVLHPYVYCLALAGLFAVEKSEHYALDHEHAGGDIRDGSADLRGLVRIAGAVD